MNVFLRIGDLEPEIIGCEWTDEEENKITYAALERRGLQSLIKKQTIRLKWHTAREPSKIRPTLFRVVPDGEVPGSDIRFGKNWTQAAPMGIETSNLGGKRKRNGGKCRLQNNNM